MTYTKDTMVIGYVAEEVEIIDEDGNDIKVTIFQPVYR